MTNITIGNSVTSIGDYAFNGCINLTDITIPNSVTSIGLGVFFDCDRLTSVMIPDSVTSIGDEAFAFCSSLTSATIGDGVTSIGYGPFALCYRLASITVNETNAFYTSVAGVLFNGDQTTLIQCPGGKDGSYPIPDSVTNVGVWAFYGCNLTNVTIPNSVISIGSEAFSFCYSLTSVSIPHSVTSIGHGVFAWCPKLTVITVDPRNAFYGDADGVLFSKVQNMLVAYPGGKAGAYTIPNSASSIGNFALAGCTGVTGITIGESVTNIGSYAFYQCRNLASVTISASVNSIGDWAFADCDSNLISIYFKGNAPGLGRWVLSYDENVTVYRLPGTSGWGSSLDYRPVVLWNPLMQASGPSFGVLSNQFGFNITGTTNIPIVVEASANLASASWTALEACTLTNGSVYFSDPAWTNYRARFYRIRSP